MAVAVAGYMGLTASGIFAPDAPEEVPAAQNTPAQNTPIPVTPAPDTPGPANTTEAPEAAPVEEVMPPEVTEVVAEAAASSEVAQDAPPPEMETEAEAAEETASHMPEPEVAEETKAPTQPDAPEEVAAEETTAPEEDVVEDAAPTEVANTEVAKDTPPPAAPVSEAVEETAAPEPEIAPEIAPEVAEESAQPAPPEPEITEDTASADIPAETPAQTPAPDAAEDRPAETEIALDTPDAPSEDTPASDQPDAADPEPAVSTDHAQEDSAREDSARASEIPDPAPEPAVTDTSDAPETPPVIPRPTYDLVRVEPDGSALVAGEGAPRAEVTIYLDGDEIAETLAGTDGKFVSLMDIPPSRQPRLMSLSMTVAGARIFADTEVIVAPFGPTPQAPAADTADGPPPVVIAAAEPPTEPPEAPIETPPPPVETSTPDPEPTTPPDPAAEEDDAPRILAADEEGVRVLSGPEVLDRVAIDTISYDDAGDVALAGRGAGTQGGGFVRVYLDNTPITTSRIRADGSWRVTLPQVDKGVYVLRVDEVDEDGEVRSRAETPFQREDRDTLEQASKEAEGGAVRIITVQPGNTLWQIARERYGEGILYVRVFDANRGQIRDPDLIYPGQVFDLPKEQ